MRQCGMVPGRVGKPRRKQYLETAQFGQSSPVDLHKDLASGRQKVRGALKIGALKYAEYDTNV